MSTALDIIGKLKPKEIGDKHVLDAADCLSAYPCMVHSMLDGAQGYNAAALIPVLVEVVKEQQSIIDKLLSDVAKLASR